MPAFSYFNPLDRELVPGQQFAAERWTIDYLRKRGLISTRYFVSLPYEIWSIIFWYLLEPVISPHTYCSSDTYPELHLQLWRVSRPDYQDWLRCRLVCRTWYEILRPYPHITFSERSRIDDGDIRGTTSMYCKPYSPLVQMTIDLHHHQRLVNQLTVLRFQYYSGWSPGAYDMYPHDFIDFSNVRCLCLSAWNTGASWTDFWPSLSRGFPRLVSLSIQGMVPCSRDLNLPLLETLGFHPTTGPDHMEPVYDLPKLKHLSLYGPYYPRRLLRNHGPFLHSLIPHSANPEYDLTDSFWDHFVSLRTVGLCPRGGQIIDSPPDGHPLRHLAIFVSSEESRRILVIESILAKFPDIHDLSVQVHEIRRQEKKDLLRFAKQSNVSIHFLSQTRTFRYSRSKLSLLFIQVMEFRIMGWRVDTVCIILLIIPLIPPAMTVDYVPGSERPDSIIGGTYIVVTYLFLCIVWFLCIYYALCGILGYILNYVVAYVLYLAH
jgi:hypothetical protein